MSKLTLQQKKNLRDFEPQRVERLAKLKALTGIDFEFSCMPSIEDLTAKVLEKGEADYANRIGECLYGPESYLEHALKFFEKQWGDELVREALTEACKEKKIMVREKESWDAVEFEAGVFYINIKIHQFWLYLKYISDFDPSSKL